MKGGKLYFNVLFHLEREQRLNGFGAADATLVVPLKNVDTALSDKKKNNSKKLLFSTANTAVTKLYAANWRKKDSLIPKREK